MDRIYSVLLDNGVRCHAKADASLELKEGDACVFRKDFFQDFGQIVKALPSATTQEESDAGTEQSDDKPESAAETGRHSFFSAQKNEVFPILRKATDADQEKAARNLGRAKSSLRSAWKHVEALKLPMKLINAHVTFDERLIVIQFSADGRVDFRELVKLLSQEFNTRIELRQIGVRDETSILGGISVCGRPFCCCLFLKEFASINVKMAKEQDLSLTPSTISGACGRLKCCLKYEHAGYLELEKTMPRRNDCCECSEGRGRVVDRNLLTQKVSILLDGTSRIVVCPASEVTVVYPEKYKGAPRSFVRGGSARTEIRESDGAEKTSDPNGGGGRRHDEAKRRKAPPVPRRKKPGKGGFGEGQGASQRPATSGRHKKPPRQDRNSRPAPERNDAPDGKGEGNATNS